MSESVLVGGFTRGASKIPTHLLMRESQLYIPAKPRDS